MASGSYIGFVDSDDFISKDMYEILLKELIKENADFIKSNFIAYSNDGIIYEEKHDYNLQTFNKFEALDDFFYTKYNNDKPMKSTLCDGLYKRDMFFNDSILEIEFPIGKINEDTYVFPQLIMKAQKILHLDEGFYYYRKRNDSITTSNISISEIESCDLWITINSIVSKETNKYTKICVLNSAIRYLLVLERIYFSKFRKEFFSKIRKEFLDNKLLYNDLIENKYIQRTMKLIRVYPLYLFIRRIFGRFIY